MPVVSGPQSGCSEREGTTSEMHRWWVGGASRSTDAVLIRVRVRVGRNGRRAQGAGVCNETFTVNAGFSSADLLRRREVGVVPLEGWSRKREDTTSYS